MNPPLPAPGCSIYYSERDNNPGIIINPNRKSLKAFTLIELSIVLVIIGLIVGGILVGRTLIDAAAARSQISQIQEFQQAVNTFKGKYGYLPGDIPDPDASNFGFIARGTATVNGKTRYAQGDGDNMLMGRLTGSLSTSGNGKAAWGALTGEIAVFWVDLSTAKLIKAGLNTADMSTDPGAVTATNSYKYYPRSKLSDANYVSVFTGPANSVLGLDSTTAGDGTEHFQLTSTLSPATASQIDAKTDDGLPQTGKTKATITGLWVNIYAGQFDSGPTDTTSATPPTAATCYDDGGVTGTKRKYSATQTGTCSLSFDF